jgi:tetratricopeptide (TPR) repeat protein
LGRTLTNIIPFDGRPRDTERPPATGMSALRIITGMAVDEFAEAVGRELGWPVPLYVYLEWEQDDGAAPPPRALEAARDVAIRNPIGAQAFDLSRRRFLGGVIGLSTLAAAGFPISTRSLSGMLAIGGPGRAWRASTETADDLETLVGSYRRAYAGKTAATDLLPGTTGLMHLLIDLGRRDQWPAEAERLASLVGQAALVVGLLQLMGSRDLGAAKVHYDLALRSAREANDWDLASYVLGSLAFRAALARRPADARTIVEAASDLAGRYGSPRTRAWAAALASELHARAGREVASRRSLEDARAALDGSREDPSWKGVGCFDEARLLSYDGASLLLLGKYAAAEELLRLSLKRLDPQRLKHRSTTSADLAMVLALRGEVEESCARAGDALIFASAISHRQSVDRVRGVHFRLMRWRGHPAVRQLTERLEAA